MIAGRRSKTVAFVTILALTTFGAFATASAQPADIIALDKAFQDHYAHGNYAAAQIDAQKFEHRRAVAGASLADGETREVHFDEVVIITGGPTGMKYGCSAATNLPVMS
jgi:hypothetical protein